MNGTCSVCRRSISPKTRIYQLSVGYYYRRNETPTYESSTSVIQECHEDCLSESFDAQPPPYDCSLCNGRLKHGTRVVYGVLGDKPAPGYKRPERRGHEMPFIAHDLCFESYVESYSTKARAATA
jgi:hypothetical protein